MIPDYRQIIVNWLNKRLAEEYPNNPCKIFAYQINTPIYDNAICAYPLLIQVEYQGRADYSKFTDGWTTPMLESHWDGIKVGIDGIIQGLLSKADSQ